MDDPQQQAKPLTLTLSHQAVVSLRAHSGGGGGAALQGMDEQRRGRVGGEGREHAAGDDESGPSSGRGGGGSTTNAVGTAIVFAVPASRLARWLWARRRPIGGLAMGVAAGGPGVVGRGLVRLGVASVAAMLLPGGWRTIQGLALVGCVPAEAGLKVRKAGGGGVLTLRAANRKKKNTLAGASFWRNGPPPSTHPPPATAPNPAQARTWQSHYRPREAIKITELENPPTFFYTNNSFPPASCRQRSPPARTPSPPRWPPLSSASPPRTSPARSGCGPCSCPSTPATGSPSGGTEKCGDTAGRR
jgi:hypothetical protein